MKWSKDLWSLNSLTYNPVVLCFEHHLTWNALLFGKCMWHGRRAFPEQFFQWLMHACSMAPVHHRSIACSVCVIVLFVCFCWVINIYITHENRRSRCQNDSFGCIHFHGTQPHTLLLHCCSFLLGRVVYMWCSDVVWWSFACLRKEMLCVWFYWISQCMMREM